MDSPRAFAGDRCGKQKPGASFFARLAVGSDLLLRFMLVAYVSDDPLRQYSQLWAHSGVACVCASAITRAAGRTLSGSFLSVVGASNCPSGNRRNFDLTVRLDLA